jgi:myo-inositol 2-dehydrogenase/D-chiro-inositol 1-dehydrogenase
MFPQGQGLLTNHQPLTPTGPGIPDNEKRTIDTMNDLLDDHGHNDLRVAVLGAGAMGSYHIATLSQKTKGAVVTVVSDYYLERAQAAADIARTARVVDDPFEAIAAEDVDAVLIATPGHAHEAQILACIERGIPALVEKPLTADVGAALKVMAAENAFGRQLVQVGFMRRFDPEHQQLRGMIDAGEFGAPLMVHYTHRNPSGPEGFTSALMISESVVHEVDAVRYLLDEEIAAISVVKGRATANAPAGVNDPLLVVMESASGCVVTDEIYVWSGAGYQVRAELVGERGSAVIGLNQHLVRRGTDGRWGGSIATGFVERFDQAYVRELQAWVNASREGRVDGPGSWDGYAATVVCDAGIAALETGQRVPVTLGEKPGIYPHGSASLTL